MNAQHTPKFSPRKTSNMQIVLGGSSIESSLKTNPNVFDSIIGQESAKTTIGFFVNSHNPVNPFPTLLFTGSHGLGKTFFASLVAKSLGRNYLEINCGDLQDGEAFMDLVLDKLDSPTTILFDEAHSLSKEITTILLTFLNPNSKHRNEFVYKGVAVVWDLTKVNVIFATTDSFEIFKPLKNRCQEIYFELYSNDEMFEIVKLHSGDVKISCDKNDLSFTCRNRARDAYVMATNIKRMVGETSKEFNQNNLNAIKRILGIYDMGIKKPEMDLLKRIYNSQPISASNLAIKMGINVKNVEQELEPRLRELGLVDSTPRGRILTKTGIDYIKQHST